MLISIFRPFARLFSSSTFDLSTFCVVHVWVNVTPFWGSAYLASRSPLMIPLWLRSPKTRKLTAEGVRVLTSSEVPWRGKSLDRRSCDALPISYVNGQYSARKTPTTKTTTNLPGGGSRYRAHFLFLSEKQTDRQEDGRGRVESQPTCDKQGAKYRPPDHSVVQTQSPQRST